MSNPPIYLSGNLTQDPRLKRVAKDQLVCELKVATSRSVRDETEKSGWRDTDQLYIRVEVWGDLAYNCRRSLRKGSAVIVRGTLFTDSWTPADAAAGERRYEIKMRGQAVAGDLARRVLFGRESRDIVAQWRGMDDDAEAAEFLDNFIDHDLVKERVGRRGAGAPATAPTAEPSAEPTAARPAPPAGAAAGNASGAPGVAPDAREPGWISGRVGPARPGAGGADGTGEKAA